MTAFSSWQPESTPPRALSSRPPLVGTLARHVLLAVARRPDIRVVDLAESVGLSVRAVQSILADLVADGSVERCHEGRRTDYRVHGEKHFRHRR